MARSWRFAPSQQPYRQSWDPARLTAPVGVGGGLMFLDRLFNRPESEAGKIVTQLTGPGPMMVIVGAILLIYLMRKR